MCVREAAHGVICLVILDDNFVWDCHSAKLLTTFLNIFNLDMSENSIAKGIDWEGTRNRRRVDPGVRKV
jgi:hypothetical protein